MEETHERTLERTRRYLRDRLRPRLYRDVRPARVSAWTTPGEPIPFAEAIAQRFVGIEPGEAWGPPWGTTWFRVAVDRPQQVIRRYVVLDAEAVEQRFLHHRPLAHHR